MSELFDVKIGTTIGLDTDEDECRLILQHIRI